MSDSLLDRMDWNTAEGQITDQDRRYVMIRNDVLMGIFGQLEPSLAAQALKAFERSVNLSGGQSAKAYFESLDNDASRLLDTMVAFSAQLGWGLWSFTRQANELQLAVRNSPFAAGYPKPAPWPVCHPIVGMLRTVGELVLGCPVNVIETQCCACHATAQDCQFTIAPVAEPHA